MVKTVYLSLGSNVGHRDVHLKRALERLEMEDLRVLRTSAVYETQPRDVPDQAWFLNQVVEIETSLLPLQLLGRTQKIERALGRISDGAKGPRTIDIDILLYAQTVVATPGLDIPHPRMADRRFVLEPLAELAPDLRHPQTGYTVRELLAQVSNQRVQKI
jgi:2-amino-4-hydroxy-6-hydroxymethyldihydropteridine diphosphokinase